MRLTASRSRTRRPRALGDALGDHLRAADEALLLGAVAGRDQPQERPGVCSSPAPATYAAAASSDTSRGRRRRSTRWRRRRCSCAAGRLSTSGGEVGERLTVELGRPPRRPGPGRGDLAGQGVEPRQDAQEVVGVGAAREARGVVGACAAPPPAARCCPCCRSGTSPTPTARARARIRPCVGPAYSPPTSVMLPPRISSLSVRPPTRSRASSTITERPAAVSARAAVRPASPAPTIATSALRVRRPRPAWAAPAPSQMLVVVAAAVADEAAARRGGWGRHGAQTYPRPPAGRPAAPPRRAAPARDRTPGRRAGHGRARRCRPARRPAPSRRPAVPRRRDRPPRLTAKAPLRVEPRVDPPPSGAARAAHVRDQQRGRDERGEATVARAHTSTK